MHDVAELVHTDDERWGCGFCSTVSTATSARIGGTGGGGGGIALAAGDVDIRPSPTALADADADFGITGVEQHATVNRWNNPEAPCGIDPGVRADVDILGE